MRCILRGEHGWSRLLNKYCQRAIMFSFILFRILDYNMVRELGKLATFDNIARIFKAPYAVNLCKLLSFWLGVFHCIVFLLQAYKLHFEWRKLKHHDFWLDSASVLLSYYLFCLIFWIIIWIGNLRDLQLLHGYSKHLMLSI